MTQIKSFKDLGIGKPKIKGFIGDSISIKKVLDKPVLIHFSEIQPSLYPDKGDGKRLAIQITYNNEKRVIWTSAMGLRQQILEINTEDLPINATFREEDERFFLE